MKVRGALLLLSMLLAAGVHYYIRYDELIGKARVALSYGISREAIPKAYEALELMPLASEPTLLLDEAARNLSDAMLDQIAKGEWPRLNETYTEISASVRPYASEKHAKDYINKLRGIIGPAAIERMQVAFGNGDAMASARYLVTALQANSPDQSSEVTQSINRLMAVIDGLMSERKYRDVYGILSGIQASLDKNAMNDSVWGDAPAILTKCVEKRGVKLPKQSALKPIFREAGFIVLDDESDVSPFTFKMTISYKNLNGRSYVSEWEANRASLPFYEPSIKAYRMDTRATIQGALADIDNNVLMVLSKSFTKNAPDQVMFNDSSSGEQASPTQEQIQEAAKEYALILFKQALGWKLPYVIQKLDEGT